MTELQRLYERRHHASWRGVYRRVRKDPAFFYRHHAAQTPLVLVALYALGFRESPRALHQSARYGGTWPGRLP